MEALTAPPRCPLCGQASPSARGLPEPGRVRVVRCEPCGVAHTWPVPGPGERAALHAPGRFRAEGGERFRPWVEAAVALFRRARSRRIARGRAPGAALDVGCGRGLFLHHLRERGWRVAGAELDEATAECARRAYGLDVAWGDPEGWGLAAASVDVVTLYHSLEHAHDPAGLLRRCRDLLRPGGLLVVAVPNLASWQARAGGDRWFHLDLPRHLTHFTARGLSELLHRLGFRVVDTRRFCAEHGPFGWLQTGLNRVGLEKNALFRWLRRGTDGAGRPPGRLAVAASLALVPLWGAAALVLAALESLVPGGGGAVEVWAVKRAGDPGETP